jgi:hypothetical protein
MDDFNDKLVVDSIQAIIRNALQRNIGTTDLEAVKNNLANCLEMVRKQKLIEPNFEIGKCGQLWSLWSLKQKLKWYFYNKTPIIKDLSAQIRKEIWDYNLLLVDPETHEYAEMPKEYPEHLIPDPKSIIIVDTKVKLSQGLNFISIDMTLGKK